MTDNEQQVMQKISAKQWYLGNFDNCSISGPESFQASFVELPYDGLLSRCTHIKMETGFLHSWLLLIVSFQKNYESRESGTKKYWKTRFIFGYVHVSINHSIHQYNHQLFIYCYGRYKVKYENEPILSLGRIFLSLLCTLDCRQVKIQNKLSVIIL